LVKSCSSKRTVSGSAVYLSSDLEPGEFALYSIGIYLHAWYLDKMCTCCRMHQCNWLIANVLPPDSCEHYIYALVYAEQRLYIAIISSVFCWQHAWYVYVTDKAPTCTQGFVLGAIELSKRDHWPDLSATIRAGLRRLRAYTYRIGVFHCKRSQYRDGSFLIENVPPDRQR
jgi:hypothetical protein